MVFFLLLSAEKKTPFLVHPKQTFGSSYFATALEYLKTKVYRIGVRGHGMIYKTIFF